jgi:hypothetical protein
MTVTNELCTSGTWSMNRRGKNMLETSVSRFSNLAVLVTKRDRETGEIRRHVYIILIENDEYKYN